jgi:small neutral amino acid transporter SnatA (MarC family)
MNKMTKRIAASVVTMLIAVSMIQSATAAERTRKHHVAATTNEQVRNANASVVPFYAYPAESGSFRDEALSPPAGR